MPTSDLWADPSMAMQGIIGGDLPTVLFEDLDVSPATPGPSPPDGGRFDGDRNISDGTGYTVNILVQPDDMRFRYPSEGKHAGALMGKPGPNGERRYMTIEVVGVPPCRGSVRVSCVEANAPHRIHPHRLVGNGCGSTHETKKGVCEMPLQSDMKVIFDHLGIHVPPRTSSKYVDLQTSVQQRKELSVDPFNQGFAQITTKHGRDTIDINAVRLCFEVTLTPPHSPQINLPPIVSDVINNSRHTITQKRLSDGNGGEMELIDASDNTAPIEGGKKIIIVCKNIKTNDVRVSFKYRNQSDEAKEVHGEFTGVGVHNDSAIVFKTPALIGAKINNGRVHALMFLRKPSDSSKSNHLHFYFTPRQSSTTEFQDFKQPLTVKRKNCERGKEQSTGQDSTGKLEVPPKSNPEPQPGTSGSGFTKDVLRLANAGLEVTEPGPLYDLLDTDVNLEELRKRTEPKKEEELPDLGAMHVSEELSNLNAHNNAIGQTQMTPDPVVTSVLEPTHGEVVFEGYLDVVNPDSLVDNNAIGPTEMTDTRVKRQTSSLETPDNSA